MFSNAHTVLEWTYEPDGFFGECVTFSYKGGEITLAEGHARGEFDARFYDCGEDFLRPAHEHVSDMFLAQQVMVQSQYKLLTASMFRHYTCGRRDQTIFLEGGHLKLSGASMDSIFRNTEGKVVYNSKTERLEKQAKFRADVAKLLPDEPMLRRMLQSFRNALSDRDNLLIHLYEVREALTTACGNEKNAISAAEISKSCWKKFGRMANDSLLLEGRHRGRRDRLRSATPKEIDWALCFAQKLIEGYVRIRTKPN